jgi:hypothetical protein
MTGVYGAGLAKSKVKGVRQTGDLLVSVVRWTYGKMGCICPLIDCRTVSLG